MDLASLIGFIGAVGAIIATMIMGGGVAPFIDTQSIFIVFGGTFFCVMYQNPLPVFLGSFDQMLHTYAGQPIDKVVGLEARGFILGGAIAHQLGTGFVPVRKKGKLPGTTISQDYKLEYGEAIVEIHDDAIEAGERILVVDDLLATGGTAEAGIKLIERLGGDIVGCSFIVDLPELGGREKLQSMNMDVQVLCEFDGL